MPRGRLSYDIHARFGARRRASATVGSRDPEVDNVLIAGRAGTSAWGADRPGDQRCGATLSARPDGNLDHLDENVLHRVIGGSKVRRSQLYRLADLAEHPKPNIPATSYSPRRSLAGPPAGAAQIVGEN